ncbi:hypothetical protein SKAU_G00384460 [Synaphobranchus kaupii]|uniref:Uncharacterized protein n=1 Tax=Synaphobranchus kaupii TaxID=118154 RepID=A0A9Q1EEH3_SYNKA|nr:hypothetical protein SKAU_G00384460 [Synaphobranchus kaupii]
MAPVHDQRVSLLLRYSAQLVTWSLNPGPLVSAFSPRGSLRDGGVETSASALGLHVWRGEPVDLVTAAAAPRNR